MSSNLYMPIFYNSLELTSALSDEEFGRVVRLLLSKLGNNEAVDLSRLSKLEKMAYGFLLDGAERIVSRERPTKPHREGYYAKKEYKRSGIDHEEAFKRAVERTYGKNAPELKSFSDA